MSTLNLSYPLLRLQSIPITIRWACLFFFAINLLQAGLTHLTGDEALYWMHSVHLDWGYRDHPPMIGAWIKMGDSVFHHPLGVRLVVAISQSIFFLVLWDLVQPTKVKSFLWLMFSVPVISLYGFIATPDVPLMLFTSLYLRHWKRFLIDTHFRNAFVLGLLMALLMWSKYHGIFIITFCLIPIRRMWLNKYFWMAALIGVLLYIPHLAWQISNDLPTVKFHLNERNNDKWHLPHILGYMGGQLAVFNPIVLVWATLLAFRLRKLSEWENSLRWLFIIMLFGFLLNSCRGRVEPHWTAPLSIPAIYFILRYGQWKRWIHRSLAFIAGVLVVLRVGMIVDILPPLHREFHRPFHRMMAIHDLAKSEPVVFMNSYQNPSLYMFYTGQKAHSINNVDGGKNQFDFWDYNDIVHKQPCFLVASYDHPDIPTIEHLGFQFDAMHTKEIAVAHHLKLWTDEWYHACQAGATIEMPAWLINGNHYAWNFKDGHRYQWTALMDNKKSNMWECTPLIEGLPDELEAGDSCRVIIRFQTPDFEGRHLLAFALQIDQMPRTYQSNWQRMVINK